MSENLVCSFAVVRQLFGCNLLAFWLSTYLPFMFFVLWPLVWSLCDLPSRMPICDYYLHFLVRCGLAVIMLFRATRSNVKRLMYAFLFDNPSAKPTRVARPARFVGFRRHKPVRRLKPSSIRFSKCCCRVLLTLFYASLALESSIGMDDLQERSQSLGSRCSRKWRKRIFQVWQERGHAAHFQRCHISH